MKTQKTNQSDNPNQNQSSQYNYPHFFKTAYGPKDRQQISFPGQSRTKQSFKSECDINHIMARYQKTGVLDFTQKHAPQYADCTGVEFQAGMEIITKAKAMFADLPSTLRTRFHNEPGEFLDFVQDPNNRDEARRLGLLRPEQPQATPLAPPGAHAHSDPLRDAQGQYREHTRSEKRADIRQAAQEAGKRAAGETADGRKPSDD